jgi:hypothetical protein
MPGHCLEMSHMAQAQEACVTLQEKQESPDLHSAQWSHRAQRQRVGERRGKSHS